jgi:hypothetical protein
MFTMSLFKIPKQLICSLSIILLLIGTLTGCTDKIQAVTSPSVITSPVKVTSKLAEVATPKLIRQLNQDLEQYQPQVKILQPQSNQIISDSNLQVNLQVLNLPIFKNQSYEMGPNLHLILDNEPYRSIYDVSQPITLENLAPGSHTLRVFAAKPWGESFKNDGAYAQVTFHVFTKSNDNTPDSNLPLLTYNMPKGGYGEEPIMIDYYLTNAPLHLVAQQKTNDNIADWRIKITVNGESFFVDTWQSIYLKGFKPGNNWIQLEFIDENGREIGNVFNDTVRVINYQPNGDDTLAKLIRGELSLESVKGIVNPNYSPIIVTPEIEPEITPPVVEEVIPEVTPSVEENEPEIITLEEEVTPEVTPSVEENEPEIITSEEEISPEVTPSVEENENEIVTTEEENQSKIDTSIEENEPEIVTENP